MELPWDNNLVFLLMLDKGMKLHEQRLDISLNSGACGEQLYLQESRSWEGEGVSWDTDTNVGLAGPRWCPWALLRQDTKCVGEPLIAPNGWES